VSTGQFTGALRGGKAKLRLWERDGGKCHLCGQTINMMSEATRDHLVPLSKGGCTCSGNIALAHRRCNTRRGNDETFRTTFGTKAQKRRKGHLLVDHR
jgi:5-methylcytosine-specific restriction endonuclease McrA